LGDLWVKICGLRTVAAIEAAADAGAQAVGFVFHAGSPRNLPVQEAAGLQAAVPRGIERVAVFLHPSQELVDAVVAAVRPDWVQMDEADLATLRLPQGQRVLPVLRGAVTSWPASGRPARMLFESGRSGSGEKADWAVAAPLARSAELVLAGGLDAANVGEAIACVRPFGVDVSSGVESSRGVKDAARMRDFVTAARAAHARHAGGPIEEMQR
jgi:phosphoribosylanthranilate isomerase